MEIKKIQIYPDFRGVHTSYLSLIKNPPDGYEFIGNETSLKIKFLERIRYSKIARKIYHYFLKVFSTTKILDSLIKGKQMKEADLIFSTDILYDGELPWILDILDSPFCLGGNNYNIFVKNKNKIEKTLERDNCKKIICAHETSFDFMGREFSKKVKDKLILIRPSIEIPVLEEKKKSDRKKILFVGSINNPKDFYVKGGLDVIRVFEKIQKKKKVKLIMRCFIPNELKKRLEKNKDIEILDKKISSEELCELYRNSDVLFLPSHQYILMAVLEAMSFELPIVALDTYAVKDYVKDGYNGFVVKKSEKIESYKNKSYPTNTKSDFFMEEIAREDKDLIKRLSEKILFLIDNEKVRERLGKNGRKTIKDKFSIEERNKKLKAVFDEALN